jgi:hypothetical protein
MPAWPAEQATRVKPPTISCRTDANGQVLAYVYFEDQPGRRAAAKLLTGVRHKVVVISACYSGVFWRVAERQLDRVENVFERLAERPLLPFRDHKQAG